VVEAFSLVNLLLVGGIVELVVELGFTSAVVEEMFSVIVVVVLCTCNEIDDKVKTDVIEFLFAVL